MSTSEIQSYLEELKTEYPYLVQSVEPIGQSLNSKQLLAVQLSYSKPRREKERRLK